VGIDPHDHLLHQWGLTSSAEGARSFGMRVVDAAAGSVGIVKPQVAFFERFGSAGYRALEEIISASRSAGLLVIADVKRGDIDTSFAAYASAWIGDGSPLESDAMTVSPFQGVGSLAETMATAQQTGKGLFVLAATSNPEAAVIQTARVRNSTGTGGTVAREIVDEVSAFNGAQVPHTFGSIGVVIGATLDLGAYGIDDLTVAQSNLTPILAPGFGHQGAELSAASRIFGALTSATIVSESRSVLASGPRDIADAIASRATEVRNIFG
jgi:orotidine-5'-phosphate decarboxylase